MKQDLAAVAVPGAKHPAVFTPSILSVIAQQLDGYGRVLDPFAGTGRIHTLEGHETVGVEIEPEWAVVRPGTIVGDATCLPFSDGSFDAVATSPTYGNRFADHHNPKDSSVRRSYKFDLGRDLAGNNTGQMHWGDQYRDMHRLAWAETERVLRPGGVLVLNMKDHIRRGAVQQVTAWHISVLHKLGMALVSLVSVAVRGMGMGANGKTRVPVEYVITFRKDAFATVAGGEQLLGAGQ